MLELLCVTATRAIEPIFGPPRTAGGLVVTFTGSGDMSSRPPLTERVDAKCLCIHGPLCGCQVHESLEHQGPDCGRRWYLGGYTDCKLLTCCYVSPNSYFQLHVSHHVTSRRCTESATGLPGPLSASGSKLVTSSRRTYFVSRL